MVIRRSTLTLACALAFAVAAVGPLAQAAPVSQLRSTADHWVTTSTQAHVLRANSLLSGMARTTMPVHVEVALKLQNRELLDNFIANQHNPTNFFYRETLEPADVVAEFSPSADQVQAVVHHLQFAGFANIQVAANRLLVSADGNAASVLAAFHTHLADVTTGAGRAAYTNLDGAQVPAALSDTVQAVLGLQTETRAHTMIQPGPRLYKGKPGGGGSTGVVGHNPTTFASIYSAGGVSNGTGVTVGIITDGVMTATLSDFNQFLSQNGLSQTNSVVQVGAAGTDTSGTPEWDLDSQDIVGMSGGVGSLIFYDATSLSDADLTAAYNKAVSDNKAKIINVSLGECETSASSSGAMATDDAIFKTAVAQGQTFSVSSGDSGSAECGRHKSGASYPASSPYVVAVGGTTLSTSGSGNTTWAGETAWSSTGGSPSVVEPRPSWQTAISGSYRGVPDVAFDADPNSGAIIIVNGSNAQYGGTSLASPLFVGSWARMLTGKSSLGFAAPHLYTLPASVYHDVTSGSNGGYSATTGWDYTTGFGSMIISSTYSAL